MLMGGGSFALLFIGLQTATPSAAAIVSQLGVPMVTLLSVLVLGELVRWRRGIGIVLAFTGVIIVMWQPGGFAASTGLIFVAGSTLSGAVGVIMLKQMEGIRPLRFQAWVGLSTLLFCGTLSFVFEQDQLTIAAAAGWQFVGLILFSALVTSVFAHTCYYGLIQRYEANLVAPLTLMAPLFTIALGIWITDDPFGIRMALGSAVALCRRAHHRGQAQPGHAEARSDQECPRMTGLTLSVLDQAPISEGSTGADALRTASTSRSSATASVMRATGSPSITARRCSPAPARRR